MTIELTVHETAICATEQIGEGARVGAFALVEATAVVGRQCTLGQGVSVGSGVVLGDDTTVGAGARLTNVVIGSNVHIDENAVLGGTGKQSSIGRGARIGANSSIQAGVAIGQGAVVKPGAAVTDPVPANAIVQGNPALIVGYVAHEPAGDSGSAIPARLTGPRETRVPGARIHPVTYAADLRGNLAAADFADLPFLPQRVFAVFGVSSEFIRGSHAHVECQQFLICVTGSIRCLLDNGAVRDEVILDGPHVGLHMPPMIWGTQYKYTRDAVLIVLASHAYDPADYIRDYEQFLDQASVA